MFLFYINIFNVNEIIELKKLIKIRCYDLWAHILCNEQINWLYILLILIVLLQ